MSDTTQPVIQFLRTAAGTGAPPVTNTSPAVVQFLRTAAGVTIVNTLAVLSEFCTAHNNLVQFFSNGDDASINEALSLAKSHCRFDTDIYKTVQALHTKIQTMELIFKTQQVEEQGEIINRLRASCHWAIVMALHPFTQMQTHKKISMPAVRDHATAIREQIETEWAECAKLTTDKLYSANSYAHELAGEQTKKLLTDVADATTELIGKYKMVRKQHAKVNRICEEAHDTIREGIKLDSYKLLKTMLKAINVKLEQGWWDWRPPKRENSNEPCLVMANSENDPGIDPSQIWSVCLKFIDPENMKFFRVWIEPKLQELSRNWN